ncbi:MFS transporter [Bradyrhizobium yuanmingense]|uniref:MFS transporter n=1 Tax=Bradyrhizobium yuanmingense TaxID=108015 RepID=UPI000687483F|nr:MFS transporter [Bradyrhizobium yuanmingense]
MPYIDAAGVNLYFEEAGEGHPIIFLHELGSDSREWETQVRYFSRAYRCITFNARGYAPSDVPDDPTLYGWELAVNDIAAVMRGLVVEHAHLVGLSMGGYAALQFGLRRTINALVAAPLTLELGLDAGDLGLLTSVYFLTFAAAQIPVGILLDRYGPRLIQSVLLVAAAVGAALFATSDNLLMLLLGRALLGLGVAASLTAGLKALVLWFPNDRLPFLNGLMVMLGALGAVTATSPAQLLLAWVGWRTLFALFAVVTAGCSAMIYLLVPESASATPVLRGTAVASLKKIYTDPHFWRLAPLSATSVGTAWALQGLWAAQWFTDVEGLDRAALVQHLFVMAVALSLGALLLGVLADRLRRYGIGTEALLAVVGLLFIAVQLAIILRWPLSSYVLWAAVAAVGAATVLSYVLLASYFPKELAGRANAALNVLHIGGAFVLQYATGVVLEHWTPQAGHYPEIAYQTAFISNLVLQIIAWVWFAFRWVLRPPALGSAIRSASVGGGGGSAFRYCGTITASTGAILCDTAATSVRQPIMLDATSSFAVPA